LFAGLFVYQTTLWIGELEVVSSQSMEQHQSMLLDLQNENQQLFDELFRPKDPWSTEPDDGILPYDGNVDGRVAVTQAREKAKQEKKILMVTFGANWCQDCRNLHRTLKSDVVAAYTSDVFQFVNVDVGKFNQNKELANELGVSLKKGIPVAIFFDVDGQVIGTTNQGQLEPARHYSSMQILKFVRDVAERSRILAPDAVR
jgi:thioredoxin-related protein